MRRCVLLALPLFVLVPLLSADPPARPKKLALLAGVNNYDGTGLNSLRHAVRDMEKLKEELASRDFEVVLLTNQKATRQGIEDALQALLKKRGKGDLLLVAFSGHGMQTKDTEGKEDAFFCPSDADKAKVKTLVSLSDLVAEMGPKGVNLLLVDACRNDPGRGVKGIQGNRLKDGLPENTAVLFSCSAGQESFETTRMYGEDSRDGNGIFFYHVLEGLRGKAKDPEDGKVTWNSLAGYVTNNVNRRAKEWLPDIAEREARNKEVALERLKFQTPHQLINLDERVVLSESSELAKEVVVDLGGGVKMEFVYIPKGKFFMGSPKDEKDRSDNEDRHEVEITRDFYLGKYPVMQEQYERLMGENPSYFSPGGDGKEKVKELDTKRFPVENVSWEDAVKFCDKLTDKHGAGGRKYRLPTEAEWEYASRGGKETAFYFGSSCNGTEANCDGRFPYGTSEEGPYLRRTCEVGSYARKAPHPWGLCDMHGNVYQWCADWYGPYAGLPNKDPVRIYSIKDDKYHVLRGGSWETHPAYCRAADRTGPVVANRYGLYGCRVAFRLD